MNGQVCNLCSCCNTKRHQFMSKRLTKVCVITEVTDSVGCLVMDFSFFILFS